MNARVERERVQTSYVVWQSWPLSWTAIFVGALTAFALSVIFTLSSVAIGANELPPDFRLVDLRQLGFWMMVLGIFGSFFAFVGGGWVAGKIAGTLHSEPAMLHGAIVWLMAIPLFAALSAVGVTGLTGSWLAGLSAQGAVTEPPYVRPELSANATEQQRLAYDADWTRYQRDVAKWRAETPKAARNTALFAVSALLIGLMGSVIGAWMACGEPMSLRYRRPIAVS